MRGIFSFPNVNHVLQNYSKPALWVGFFFIYALRCPRKKSLPGGEGVISEGNDG